MRRLVCLFALLSSIFLAGCASGVGPAIGAAAAGIVVPELLELGTDTVDRSTALIEQRNARRAMLRGLRWSAEDRLCNTITDEMARSNDFNEKLRLGELLVECYERHYPALFKGDVFSGLEEDLPDEQDNRPLSDIAAEIQLE